MKKLALVLCLAMILSILPASALAADLDSFAAAADSANSTRGNTTTRHVTVLPPFFLKTEA